MAVLLLLGCATARLPPAQDDGLVAVRAMVDHTIRVYGLPSIEVRVGATAYASGGAFYKGGVMYVHPDQLTRPSRDALIAHELGHAVLGHEMPARGVATQQEGAAASRRREVEADVKAVEILTGARGMSEQAALATMYAYLMGAQTADRARGGDNAPGSQAPCAEAHAMLARFPQHRSWYAGRRCAPVEVAGPPALTAVKVAHVPLGSVAAPRWRPGDEWTYRWESPRGGGMFAWSVDRVELVDGIDHYVVKSGDREIYWRVNDLAYAMDKIKGEIVTRYVPQAPWREWPLTSGQAWRWTARREDPKAQLASDMVYDCRIEGEESLAVPAGTFQTFKIRCVEQRSRRFREEWYAPAVKNWVRERRQLDYGIQERELISLKVRP
jgi:hypothetical protein